MWFMDGWTWYLAGIVLVSIWYAVCAFVLQPWLVLRKVILELEEGMFRGLIAEYMQRMMGDPAMRVAMKDLAVSILNSTHEIQTDKGETVKATLFQLLLAQSADYLMFRGEQWINAQKSAISRNLGKGTPGGELEGMLRHVLPKKYKDWGPLIERFIVQKQLAPDANEKKPTQQGANKLI